MKIFGDTNIGLLREINEDRFFMSSEPVGSLQNLFIIADGMGGHNAGEIAAQLAIDTFVAYCKENENKGYSIEDLLEHAVQSANLCIFKQSYNDLEKYGMGTTLVACTIFDGTIYIINIGDSRLYVVEDDLKQITIDHSYVEELVRAGEITRLESIRHPAKNKITRALGITDIVEVDIFKLSTRGIKKVLMCSDGLTNMVFDNVIFEIMNTDSTIEKQGRQLMDQAIQNGGIDNITFVIIAL